MSLFFIKSVELFKNGQVCKTPPDTDVGVTNCHGISDLSHLHIWKCYGFYWENEIVPEVAGETAKVHWNQPLVIFSFYFFF